MNLAICSDIHLEFADLNIHNEYYSEVLILAGDIMVAQDLHDHPEPINPIERSMIAAGGFGARKEAAQRFRDFLSRVSFNFPHVVYIAGNHEFYHGKWKASLQHMRDECAKFPNIHFLENDAWHHGDVTFVGGTLWTDMNKGDPMTLHAVGDMMNDFQIIRNDELGYTKLRPAHTVSRHRNTLSYIDSVVKNDPSRKYVVVGHHAPSTLSIADEFKNQQLMNGAYYSDLSEFILDRPQIKLWVHGHTHYPFDYMIGDTRIVCNPRGYVGYERGTQEVDPYEPLLLDV